MLFPIDLVVFSSLCCLSAHAAPTARSAPANPKVMNRNRTLANPIYVTDPTLNRDSCGSVRWDDQNYQRELYSYFNASLEPDTNGQSGNGYTSTLPLSGNNNMQAFYVQAADTNTTPSDLTTCVDIDQNTGTCPDKSRFPLWPNVSPMRVPSGSGPLTAYTWVSLTHIWGQDSANPNNPQKGTQVESPGYYGTDLYQVTAAPDGSSQDTLPTTTLVQQFFWNSSEYSYGADGNVLDPTQTTAYLYANVDTTGNVALAKVPVADITDKSAYQYWNSETTEWVGSPPKMNDSSYNIMATAGGQGTYYFNEFWNSYVWIGQKKQTYAFYISTAPAPQGPWTTSYDFLGPIPKGTVNTYSQQAHPGLSANSSINDIYVSYTFHNTSGPDDTFMYHVVFE